MLLSNLIREMRKALTVNLRYSLLAMTVIVAGCGGPASFVAGNGGTAATQTATAESVEYHAYGDSITYGFLLYNPQKQSYPALVRSHENVSSFANYAISGQQACDIATWQISANEDSPTLATHPYYSVLVGTNEVRKTDPKRYEPTYTTCLRAVLSWLAVPREYKVLEGDARMSISGPGQVRILDNWRVWSTAGEGASVSFGITTTARGPIYAWPWNDNSSSAIYTYALDGVVVGKSAARTFPFIKTEFKSTRSLGFIRIEDVAAGKHIVTFTQENAGAHGVSIVGVGAPSGRLAGQLPTVLAGTIPFQDHGGKEGRCTATDPLCWVYIQIIRNSVDLFHSDGLNMRLFDTRKYMFGTPKEMADTQHPNALGQQEISHAVEAAW